MRKKKGEIGKTNTRLFGQPVLREYPKIPGTDPKIPGIHCVTLRKLLAALFPVSKTTTNDREPSISVSAETRHKVYTAQVLLSMLFCEKSAKTALPDRLALEANISAVALPFAAQAGRGEHSLRTNIAD